MKKLYYLFLLLFIHLTVINNSVSQFTDYQSPFTGSLNSGDFATIPFGSMNSYHAWICGDSSMVMKLYPFSVPPQFRIVKGNLPQGITFKAMCSIDTTTAFAAGMNGTVSVVYKTTNTGQNWILVFSQPNGNINSIWFKTSQTGLMAGDPAGGRWSLFKTTNGGVNWDSAGMYLPQAGSEVSFSNDMFARGDTVWMGTNNSRIYISQNFGMNWSIRNLPGIQNIRTVNNDFASMGGNVGFIGGDSLLESYSWGNTWNVVRNIPGNGQVTGLLGSNPGVDASGFPVFYSKQGSLYYNLQGWILFHTATSGVYTYLFKARPIGQYWNNGSAMLGLMNNGKVWICNCAWGGITPINNIIPTSLKLHQNYPNPFNPLTKIKFEIPSAHDMQPVNLSVYNSLGELTAILVNEVLSSGIYEAEFDASAYSSGLYFYKITSGGISVSKKMLVVK